ncbi:MAG TPA: SDR family oxidoreductase, partial [Gemmatimonadaceae bacterium]|nr:SDR family oxidoreductase [Gemmatimonadaceae bacterium]
ELERVAAELRAAGTRVVAVPADVTSAEGREALVSTAVRELGGIDVLVNNAGVMGVGYFHTLPAEEIERTVAVNLVAPMLLTQLVLPVMLERGSGHVVNISSLSSKNPAPFIEPYAASKAGILAFTKSLRLEYHDRGISASAIIPGLVRDAGVFEAQRRTTEVRVSALLGTTTPDAVASAVVKAIRRDLVELFVNPQPLRPSVVLGELFPSLSLALTRRFGAPIYRPMARDRAARGDGGE